MMYQDAARQRTIDIARAMDDGCETVHSLHQRFPDIGKKQMHSSLTYLRIKGFMRRMEDTVGSYKARYELTGDIDDIVDAIQPRAHGVVEFGELEKAMGVPQCVVEMIAQRAVPRFVGNLGHWDAAGRPLKGAG